MDRVLPGETPDQRPLHLAASTVGLNAVLALVYFAAAKLGLALAVVHPSASAVWPPTGIALAAFLLYGKRVWPGIAIGAFAANLTNAGTIATSLGIATGNTLEGLVGAWLVNRYAMGRQALTHAGDIFKFAGLAAGLSTVLSATIGVTSLTLGGFADWKDFLDIWVTWWLGDAVGALVVAPPLLLWGSGPSPNLPRRPFEATCAVLLFVATAIAFFNGTGDPNAPVAWFWIPVVVWVSYSFGSRASATMVLVLSMLTVLGTTQGYGPFALPSRSVSLLLLQAFLGTVSVLAMTLSAVSASRLSLLANLGRARDELEARVRERTADLSRANEALSEEIYERSRLQKELLDAGEHERLRLGRDLHDDLGQLLTGIGFLSSAAEQKLLGQSRPEAKELKEIRNLVQEATTKARILSLGLTPVSLGEGGLDAALHELAEVTQRVFGVPCAVRRDRSGDITDLHAATNLYRIAQEAISNAVRHGGARRIEISLAVRPENVTLSVRDDGSGFSERAGSDGSSQHNGLGLSIMKYRADLLGGKLEIRTDSTGTTVTCITPGPATPPSA